MSGPANVPAEVALRAAEMLRVLKTDIAQDMDELSKKPFNAPTVAEAFGNLAAQVDALASVLLLILTGDRP